MPSFEAELRNLINHHSKENESNTPDFILATYMNDCLDAFNKACNRRTVWYKDDDQINKTISTADKSNECGNGK